MWSDGPSSQLKKRFIAYSVYNYYVTSSKMGLVDGIGSALKRAVHNMVTSWHVVVTDIGYRHISFLVDPSQ